MPDLPQLWRTGADGQVKAAAIGDGVVVAGSYDGIVYYYDLKGRPLGKFKAKRRGDKIMDVAVSRSGRRTAVGTHDGEVYMLDENRKILWTFKTEGRFNAAMCVALQGEGESVAVGCYDGHLYLLSGEGEARWSLAPGSAFEQRYIWSLCLSASGHIAVGTHGNSVLFLSPEGKVLWSQRGREANATMCVALPERGDVVWAGSDDRTLLLLDASGKVLRSLQAPGRVRTLSVDRRGTLLAIGSYDNRIFLADREGKLLAEQPLGEGFPWSVALSPRGGVLAAGSSDKSLYVFGVAVAIERRLAELQERAAAAKAAIDPAPVLQAVQAGDPEGAMARLQELRTSFFDRRWAEAVEARLRSLQSRERALVLEPLKELVERARKEGTGAPLVEAEARLEELESIVERREALAQELKALEGPEGYARAMSRAESVEGLQRLLEDKGDRRSRLRKTLEELEARLRSAGAIRS